MSDWQDLRISNTGVFDGISVNYVENRFSKFNELYFEGKLDLSGIPIRVFTATGSAAGNITSRLIGEYYSKQVKITSFNIGNAKLAKRAQATEKFWCEVILHEMIHVYQYQVLNLSWKYMSDPDYAHGYTFTKKMEEINNAGGWNITTRYDETSFTTTDEHTDTLKNKYYFWAISVDKSNPDSSKVVGVVSTKDAPVIKAKYPAIEFYKVNDASKFGLFKLTKSKISGPAWSKDKVQELIDNNTIEKLEIEAEDMAKKTEDECYIAAYTSDNRPEKYSCNLIKKGTESKIRQTFIKEFQELSDLFGYRYNLKFFKILDGEDFKRWSILRGSSIKRAYPLSKTALEEYLSNGTLKEMEDDSIEVFKESCRIRLTNHLFEEVYETSKNNNSNDELNGAEFYKSKDENGESCIIQVLA